MAISPVEMPPIQFEDLAQNVPEKPSPVDGFSNFLENAIGDVNQLLAKSDAESQKMVMGTSENLHDAMIAMEKAETAFRLLTQVRNRALEAYNEVLRMQV